MIATEASLYWHNYRYFPYEKELALREIETLLHPQEVHQTRQGFDVSGNIDRHSLNRLVYFQKYTLNGDIFDTAQHKLESSCVKTGSQKRQSTRYSVHGLHEYRGKFNPQIVRAILNILDIAPKSTIVDPFCGSGTTLVECSHSNVNATGCDINPMAVVISNAKLLALSVRCSLLQDEFEEIVDSFNAKNRRSITRTTSTAREDYLIKWFNESIYRDIEFLKSTIERIAGQHKDIFLVLASDLLRDYSLQEPSDLRIRRRKSPLPEKPFTEAFQEKARVFIENLGLTQEIVGVKKEPNRAYLCDSRTSVPKPAQSLQGATYDAAVTSPPYATALPYIDTQRLSLIWLGITDPGELKYLEADLTGSREFTGQQRTTWVENLRSNHNQLPPEIYDYCVTLENAVSEGDGFRRRAVPYLMYRYFSDMQDMFRNVFEAVKQNAPFALVVGHNHTTLGGQRFDINTPDLLRKVARGCGWAHQESIPLQTYHRYSIHNANAVRTETLLILRKQ